MVKTILSLQTIEKKQQVRLDLAHGLWFDGSYWTGINLVLVVYQTVIIGTHTPSPNVEAF